MVIEFNARFGDPEAMNVLTLLSSDLGEVAWQCVDGNLAPSAVSFEQAATVCKYLVPGRLPRRAGAVRADRARRPRPGPAVLRERRGARRPALDPPVAHARVRRDRGHARRGRGRGRAGRSRRHGAGPAPARYRHAGPARAALRAYEGDPMNRPDLYPGRLGPGPRAADGRRGPAQGRAGRGVLPPAPRRQEPRDDLREAVDPDPRLVRGRHVRARRPRAPPEPGGHAAAARRGGLGHGPRPLALRLGRDDPGQPP